MPLESRVIMEVAWVGNDSLLIKEVDRAARVGNVVLFQDGDSTGTVVRTLGKDGEEGDDGWIDHVGPSNPQPSDAAESKRHPCPRWLSRCRAQRRWIRPHCLLWAIDVVGPGLGDQW